MANGMRQILFVLLPAAAAILALSEPMIRLVYQRGAFNAAETTLVATALFWFAFSLPTNGLYLLQTRTFFSLQRPWHGDRPGGDRPGRLRPGGAGRSTSRSAIGGIVAGTGIGTSAAVVAQAVILRREFGGLELGRLLLDHGPDHGRLRWPWPASAAVVWDLLDAALGRGLAGQIVSLGAGLAAARLVYSRSRGCCGSPSWSRSCACCGAARCSGPGRYLLGVAELALLVGFAWLGASSLACAPAAPSFAGAPGPPGDRGAGAGAR